MPQPAHALPAVTRPLPGSRFCKPPAPFSPGFVSRLKGTGTVSPPQTRPAGPCLAPAPLLARAPRLLPGPPPGTGTAGSPGSRISLWGKGQTCLPTTRTDWGSRTGLPRPTRRRGTRPALLCGRGDEEPRSHLLCLTVSRLLPASVKLWPERARPGGPQLPPPPLSSPCDADAGLSHQTLPGPRRALPSGARPCPRADGHLPPGDAVPPALPPARVDGCAQRPPTRPRQHSPCENWALLGPDLS